MKKIEYHFGFILIFKLLSELYDHFKIVTIKSEKS